MIGPPDPTGGGPVREDALLGGRVRLLQPAGRPVAVDADQLGEELHRQERDDRVRSLEYLGRVLEDVGRRRRCGGAVVRVEVADRPDRIDQAAPLEVALEAVGDLPRQPARGQLVGDQRVHDSSSTRNVAAAQHRRSNTGMP